MGKLEGIIKSEIMRLAKREIRKVSVPLSRDVRLMKSTVSKLRKAVLTLERLTSHQQKELGKKEVPLKATPEEVKIARFSPRLFRSLRKHLGITQKELAILAGVTLGAVNSWESGRFRPKQEKKAVIVALRKMGRQGVRKLLEGKGSR
jgi:DNA-binding transcriptional regulator YiaG